MTRDKVSTLLLFGATGDLARRMLLPSLYGLHADNLLPDDFRIVCTARSELDYEQYRATAVEALKDHVPAGFYDPKTALIFSRRLSYVAMDATKPEGFKRLAKSVDPGDGLAVFLSAAAPLCKHSKPGCSGAIPAGGASVWYHSMFTPRESTATRLDATPCNGCGFL